MKFMVNFAKGSTWHNYSHSSPTKKNKNETYDQIDLLAFNMVIGVIVQYIE